MPTHASFPALMEIEFIDNRKFFCSSVAGCGYIRVLHNNVSHARTARIKQGKTLVGAHFCTKFLKQMIQLARIQSKGQKMCSLFHFEDCCHSISWQWQAIRTKLTRCTRYTRRWWHQAAKNVFVLGNNVHAWAVVTTASLLFTILCLRSALAVRSALATGTGQMN